MPGSFPFKLHQLLTTVHEEGLEWIVSWSPQGNGFKVHKVKEFVSEILPRFFIRQTKYKSFQRQLNIWDFDRITRGPLAGSYVHCQFLRGNPSLCFEMIRQRQVPCCIPDLKGNGMSDQQELETKRQGARTLDFRSQHGHQRRNEPQLKHAAHPMTLNECLAFFCEKERANRESQMKYANHPVNCSMIPPIITFDNLFEDETFMIDDHRQLAPIHPPVTSSNQWVDPYCIEDTAIGRPFNPTSLIEPVWHDLEMIFS